MSTPRDGMWRTVEVSSPPVSAPWSFATVAVGLVLDALLIAFTDVPLWAAVVVAVVVAGVAYMRYAEAPTMTLGSDHIQILTSNTRLPYDEITRVVLWEERGRSRSSSWPRVAFQTRDAEKPIEVLPLLRNSYGGIDNYISLPTAQFHLVRLPRGVTPSTRMLEVELRTRCPDALVQHAEYGSTKKGVWR